MEMTIGEYIKNKRRKIGMAQIELSLVLGVDVTHLSKIENGHREATYEQYKILEDIFGELPEFTFERKIQQNHDSFKVNIPKQIVQMYQIDKDSTITFKNNGEYIQLEVNND